MRKDTDTFDTWFSSGQWPLIVTGYPKGKDFKTFYPTSVMETGRDLIFRWVPRMVFFGLYLADKAPFHTVYLHGLVNDAKGKKMSKSKGNVVNPLALSQKYGADALRMALIVGNAPGTDLSLSEDKIRGYKHFANKVWNVGRFILEQEPEKDMAPTLEDAEIVREAERLASEVTADFENYRYHLAAEKIYHYIWHRLADEIIEESKPFLFADKERLKTAAARSRAAALLSALEISLKLLHPFMPFLTEVIWQHLPKKDESDTMLIVAPWPL